MADFGLASVKGELSGIQGSTQRNSFWTTSVGAEVKSSFIKAVHRHNPGGWLARGVYCTKSKIMCPSIVAGSLYLCEEFLKLHHGFALYWVCLENVPFSLWPKHNSKKGLSPVSKKNGKWRAFVFLWFGGRRSIFRNTWCGGPRSVEVLPSSPFQVPEVCRHLEPKCTGICCEVSNTTCPADG